MYTTRPLFRPPPSGPEPPGPACCQIRVNDRESP
jgi:hypothetical protein